VGITHSTQDLADIVQGIRHRDGAALQLVGHGGAFDVFHHHVKLVVGGECGAKLRNIGMVQAGHQLDLAQETRRQLLPSRKIRQQYLHGFDTIGNHVPNSPDSHRRFQLIQNGNRRSASLVSSVILKAPGS
jgi:hypothetical protein